MKRLDITPDMINTKANALFVRASRLNDLQRDMEMAGMRESKSPVAAAMFNSMEGERRQLWEEIEQLLTPQIEVIEKRRAKLQKTKPVQRTIRRRQ